MGEFGDKFRKAREKKELSFDDVSNVTKIGSRMLQAIEEEHFDLLPGGVFNKGFIRAYAKHLGLDAEEAVTDYLACLRQAQVDAHEVWEPQRSANSISTQPHAAPSEKRRPVEPNQPAAKSPVSKSPVEELPELQLPRAQDVRPPRNAFAGTSDREIPWRILAIAAVVVVLAVILWIRRSHTTGMAAASAAPARVESAKLEPGNVTPSAPVPVSASAPTNRDQSSKLADSTSASAHSSTPNSLPSQAAESRTGATGVKKSNAASGAEADDADDSGGTVGTSNKLATALSVKPTAPITLVIRATETSWISVIADGQNVSQETLIAPAHASIRAKREIIARIGNAAGITFLWNGQEISASGAEAEVKTFVFDATGMRVVPSTQSPAPAP
jgi:cytoskeletal protein RodZ